MARIDEIRFVSKTIIVIPNLSVSVRIFHFSDSETSSE